MELDIISIISQVGFPIAVATFSLLELNKNIKTNTLVMTRIAEKLNITTEETEK
jgi:hypothetical protein